MATADPPPRSLVTTRAFERDLKRLRKRGKDMDRLRDVVEALQHRRPLDPRHRDHALTGDWLGFRDCHGTPGPPPFATRAPGLNPLLAIAALDMVNLRDQKAERRISEALGQLVASEDRLGILDPFNRVLRGAELHRGERPAVPAH